MSDFSNHRERRCDLSHTIEAALRREELTEEEAYFVLRFAGRIGYGEAIKRLDGQGPLRRLRKWLFWIGGWETARLSQWDRGKKKWEIFGRDHRTNRLKVNGLTPLSLFGHRITFFGWGVQVKWGRGYVTLSSDHADSGLTKLYWSPNGTPGHERARFYWRRKPPPPPP